MPRARSAWTDLVVSGTSKYLAIEFIKQNDYEETRMSSLYGYLPP
jgi:hypothetical protein